MLKYLAKISKTPAEDVVVVRDGKEVHRSAENDHREKRQAEVKHKYELKRHCRKFSASWNKAFWWVTLSDDKMFCDECLASSNLMLMLVHYLI